MPEELELLLAGFMIDKVRREFAREVGRETTLTDPEIRNLLHGDWLDDDGAEMSWAEILLANEG